MIFYKFYLRDETEGDKLIGVLPERRTIPERRDRESIVRWHRLLFGNTLDTKDVYFIRAKLHEYIENGQFEKEDISAADQDLVAEEEGED